VRYALQPVAVDARIRISAVDIPSPQMLVRFTQIDYDREIALVALDDDPATDRMLEMGKRLGFHMKKNPDSKEYELVVRF
jgi:acetyltransferase